MAIAYALATSSGARGKVRAENCDDGFCSAAVEAGVGFGSEATSGASVTAAPRPLFALGGEAACFVERVRGGTACDPATPAGSPPAAAADSAFTRVGLPEPATEISPERYGVTQYPTTITLTAMADVADQAPFGGGQLLLRAVPVSTWVGFGEGAAQVDPGRRASHTWQQTGCYLLRVQTTWRGEWSLDGATWTVIGTRSGRREVEYPVAQIVGVLQSGETPEDDPEQVRSDYCGPGQPRSSTPWP